MPASFPVEVPDVEYFTRQVLCREACPVRTDSGAYVQAIAEGRYEEAYIIARTSNPFASICGRVCAAPCEAKCRRAALDAGVAIRALKRFVCEKFGVESDNFDLGRVYSKLHDPHRKSIGGGRRVAVVGAGPAGLSCAHELALMGFAPTVFEGQNIAGGMLVLGVPEYRLPRDIIRAEIAEIESLGVKIVLNHRLGRDFAFSDLKARGYEATFLGIGAHKGSELAIEGMQNHGVLQAIEVLRKINLGSWVNLGRRVVVIGGGDVAFDAARSVLRQMKRMAGMSEAELRVVTQFGHMVGCELASQRGATSAPPTPEKAKCVTTELRAALHQAAAVPEVKMYFRRDFSELLVAPEQIDEAHKEGVLINPRFGPKRILGSNGKVTGIEVIKVGRMFDENHRYKPQFIEGSEELVGCDTVILAIGQSPDLTWIQPGDNLKVTAGGELQTDPQTMATSRPDVFAGGDVAFGARNIITAVAEGKTAALSIAKFLTGHEPVEAWQTRATIYETRGYWMKPDYEKLVRRAPPMLALDRRLGTAEVEKGFPETDAVCQADRCLKCHVGPVFNGDECILCGACASVCPEFCLRLVDVADLRGDRNLQAACLARYGAVPGRGEHGAIIKDETRCIRCGLCAVRCPTGAITMEWVELLPA